MSFPLLVTGELSSIPGIPQQQTASILQAFSDAFAGQAILGLRFLSEGVC